MKSFKTYFWDVIKNHYVDFKGVATRKQYWMFALFHALVMIIIIFISLLIYGIWGFASLSEYHSINIIIGILLLLINIVIALILFVPSLAISVRRLHDINFSGWFLLFHLIPYGGSLVIFVFHVLPSENKNNKYRLHQN